MATATTLDSNIPLLMSRADGERARLGRMIAELEAKRSKWNALSKACVAMYDYAAGHEFFDHAPADLDAVLEALDYPISFVRAA